MYITNNSEIRGVQDEVNIGGGVCRSSISSLVRVHARSSQSAVMYETVTPRFSVICDTRPDIGGDVNSRRGLRLFAQLLCLLCFLTF